MKNIQLNRPIIGDDELQEVIKVLSSGCLTNSSLKGGERVQRFEESLGKYLGVKHVVAVNSGTSALQASLLALGVGAGDEVLLPSFSFIPTWETVLLTGAKPVLVDIMVDDFTMNPNDLERKITPRSRVVIPVHLYGYPAKMTDILNVAEMNQIHVLEDASQSLGASYNGLKTGSIGDLATFSFSGGKVITCGEGGAITTNNDELFETLRKTRNHGLNEDSAVVTRGLNLRMPEMEAGIAYFQLRHLNTFLDSRRRNAERLSQLLSGLNGIRLPTEDDVRRSNWYLYTVTFDKDRDLVLMALRDSGVDAKAFYSNPIHREPMYRQIGYNENLPETDWAADHVLSLPVHPSLAENDLEYIASVLKSVLKT